jgi:hypothetical protein
MTLENWIFALLAAAAVAAIYLTTPGGRLLADRLNLPALRRSQRGKQRAPKEDREYLLRVCHDDPAHVERLLAAVKRHNPEMTEAEAYRKAIRAHLNEP